MVFLRALSIFLGTVVGVGIFGLPFVAFKAGFVVVAIYFVFMVLISILIHNLFGEVVFNTKGVHRLPGYVQKYLGHKWKIIAFAIMIISFLGTLLAYLIVGGEFLFFIFSSHFSSDLTLYTLLFFILGSYLILRGIKSISKIELILLAVLIIILGIFFFKSFPLINVENFQGFDTAFVFLPYGVILFALWGTAIIPEIKEMLIRNGQKKNEARQSFKKVIIYGTIIASIIYMFFIYIVVGSLGQNITQDAISGLGQVLGNNIVKLGFIFGIIACFTSFLAIGLTMKKMLWYDFGLNKNLAWFLTCFIPLGLYFLGMRAFINIIGFVGAVAIGAEGIIIILLYRSFLKQKKFKMNPSLYVLIGLFALGIIFEAIYFLW